MGGTLYLLFAALAMLLIIGCSNVSSLLLARGTPRSREFALRSAVGASSLRIVRQLLTSLLLAFTWDSARYLNSLSTASAAGHAGNLQRILAQFCRCRSNDGIPLILVGT